MTRFADIGMFKDARRNTMLRKRMLAACSGNGTAQSEAIARCRGDILFWVNYFCWTYDPRRKSKCVPFVTYDYQDDAISKLVGCVNGGRDVAITKSRDMGASWLNVLVPLWFWQFHPMNSFLLVSRNEDYVDASNDPKSLFWKIDFLLRHQPRWLRPRNVRRTSMHIGNEDNGSVIDGESTTGEVGRGDRRTAILLDEFAAFDVKSGYNALAATQSATNCRIFNSTPKGESNAFYDVVNKSSADIITMHWSLHPEKNRGLYESVRNPSTGRMELKILDPDFRGMVEVRTKGEGKSSTVYFPDDYPFVLDGKKRSPWYDLQCARAVTAVEIAQELDIDFGGSDYNFFDPVSIEHYKDAYCRDPESVGDIEPAGENGSTIRFTPSPSGRMALYEMPPGDGRWQPERRFVIGFDISAGTGASNSTACVYDAETTEKVAEYANPTILPDEFGRLGISLCHWFNDALAVPDRTGPTGEVFVTRLMEDGSVNIYRQRDNRKIIGKISDRMGIYLNPASKTEVLHRYRDALGRCGIINRSEEAMNETMRFICRMDGTIEHSSAANAKDPSGATANHGDRVIADALACMALETCSEREIPKDVEIPVNSVKWRMEMARIEQNENGRDTLGKEWEA